MSIFPFVEVCQPQILISGLPGEPSVTQTFEGKKISQPLKNKILLSGLSGEPSVTPTFKKKRSILILMSIFLFFLVCSPQILRLLIGKKKSGN
jgi:hypothetical protein